MSHRHGSATRIALPPFFSVAAVVLVLAAALGLAGCGGESHPNRPGMAELQIAVTFDPGKAAAARHVDRVRAEAFELTAPDGAPVLRAEDEVDLQPGEDTFRLVLLVPPADRYRIRLTMEGTVAQGGSVSERGLLFAGETELTNVQAGQSHSVPIALRATFTFVALQAVDLGWRLAWTPINGAIGYTVKQTPPPPLPVVETATLATDTVFLFPPTFDPAKADVSFRVRARFPGGVTGAYSPAATSEFPTSVPPAAIQDLRTTTAGSDSLVLLWTAPGDDGETGQASAYDLRMRTAGPILNEEEFTEAEPVAGVGSPRPAGAQERFVMRGLDPATTYHFAIRTADDVPLLSEISNPASGTTLPLPPSAPTGLQLAVLSPVALRVQWLDTADDEAGFEVERQGPGDAQFIPDSTLIGSFSGQIAYLRRGLDPRSLYRFRVRSFNTGGASAWSAVAEARTAVPPPRLDSVVAVAADSVVLAWSFPPPDPTGGFRIERREGTGAFTELARPAGAARTFEDGTVRPLQTYGYRLLAADGGELSDPSAVVEVTTPDFEPVCSVSTTALDFGTVTVGSNADLGFTITNTGGGTLTGSVSEGCPAFTILTGGGSYALSAGQVHEVTVRFAPAQPGPAQCAIDLGSSMCGDIGATGTGELPAVCEVEPEALDFGTVTIGSTADLSFTITNNGGRILAGTVSEACAEFTILSGDGSYALSAGQSHTVTVRFAPLQPGAVQCPIELGSAQCADVTATGTGEAAPTCQVEPEALDFGTVAIGSSAELSFTITNNGGGTLNGFVAAQCDVFALVAGGGSYSLRTGQSRTVTVRFTPSGEAPAQCTIDTGVKDCADVPCTGSGQIPPACQVEPETLDFDPVPIGSFAEADFTITNTGGGTLTGLVSESCAEFRLLAGEGSYALGPGQVHTVTVRFTPSMESPVSCTIETGTATCVDVACSGSGLGLPVCQIAPASLDFGTVEPGEVAMVAFTITNAGGGVLAGDVYLTCANYTITSGGGVYALSAGQSREVVVEFVAPDAPGTYVCVIQAGGDCPEVACTATVLDPNAHWWGGFAGNAPDDAVYALTLSGTSLAVGGFFNSVGGVVSPTLAFWNGANWSAGYGAGIWSWVQDLAEHGGFLYAGGLDHGESYSVQRWTGDLWDYLGELNGPTHDLASYDGWLYVAGEFTTINGAAVPLVGVWAGDGWAVGSFGISASWVSDLLVSGGQLYAGASVVSGKRQPSMAAGLYSLDAGLGQWTLVAGDVDGSTVSEVPALVEHEGSIYGAVAEDLSGTWRVARFDGSRFTALGGPANGPITALASFNGSLFAAGLFSEIGGTAASAIARWDGANWRALGSGLTGGEPWPQVLLPYNGSLYVGGWFNNAGPHSSNNIARWIP